MGNAEGTLYYFFYFIYLFIFCDSHVLLHPIKGTYPILAW